MFNFFRKKVSSKWGQDAKEKDGKSGGERDERKPPKSTQSGTEKCKEISQNTRHSTIDKDVSRLPAGAAAARGAIGPTNDEANTTICREVPTPVKNVANPTQAREINKTCTTNVKTKDAVVVGSGETCTSGSGADDALIHRKVKEGSYTLDRFERKLVNDPKANKEIINLLLPENSLSYKKEESYLSKTGVQNLFDIMAGSRKKRNKGKKNRSSDNNNRRSWSFNGQRSKADAILDNDLSNGGDCKANTGNVANTEQIDFQRSAGVSEPIEASTVPREQSETTPGANVISASSRKMGECQTDDCGQTLEFRSTPADIDAAPEREACDESRAGMTSEKTGNGAKPVGREAELRGGSVQSSRALAKCDTGQPADNSADFIKSPLLEKYTNNHQSGRNCTQQQNGVNRPEICPSICAETEIEGLNSLANADRIDPREPSDSTTQSENRDSLLVNFSDAKEPAGEMGATDSTQRSGSYDREGRDNTNIPGDSDYVASECGESRELGSFARPHFKETVDDSAQVDRVAPSEGCVPSSDTFMDNCDLVRDSGTSSDEDIDEEMPESKDGETKRLKNILRESIVEDERKIACKKHVTFHSVINFDDGEKIKDDVLEDESVIDDSFASLDDEDDDEVEFELDRADNEEVPDPEFKNAAIESGKPITTEYVSIGRDSCSCRGDDTSAKKSFGESEKLATAINKYDEESTDLFKDANDDIEVENNEYLGLENTSDDLPESVDDMSSEESVSSKQINDTKAFNTIIEVKEKTSVEVREETSEESYEDTNSDNSEAEDSSSGDDDASEKETIFDSEQVLEEVRKQAIVLEEQEEEDDSAYAELLRVVEGQLMRGLAGQEGRLADLQERAAALHRVQSEVCSARKEAELVRQKLRHVEGDLTATLSRNCQLLEQLEARAEEIGKVQRRSDELAEEVARLQQKLDILLPEREQLKELVEKLRKERDQEKQINEESAARANAEQAERERSWRTEFERLRSVGAETEELLLADCEWKLRDVQRAAAERCRRAEGKLAELQASADQRCEAADRQVVELRTEMAALRATSLEQQRSLRQQTQQSGILEAAKDTLEQEARRLRTLLVMEKDAMQVVKQQHAKELDEKEHRLVARLAEEARRAEQQGRQQKRVEECTLHEKMLKEVHKKVEELKSVLAKKEEQFAETLDKAEGKADWQIMEIRRTLDKAELKHAEAMEKLQEEYSEETDRLTTESERRIKELEGALSAQACSARATLELVRGQLQAEHADALLRMKEQHRKDMEKQWELFETDKEQCLERMKSECTMEGEEEREKRDKQLLRDIDDLKHELATREGAVGSLRLEARKANDARVSAERRLSEAQAALTARETAVRAEAARQAETEKREARDTIDHLTKKCACLSNLFEDMRSRWQQAPGEAAQLRRALQDEKARAQALRRQLDALSRVRGGDSGRHAAEEKHGEEQKKEELEDNTSSTCQEGVQPEPAELKGLKRFTDDKQCSSVNKASKVETKDSDFDSKTANQNSKIKDAKKISKNKELESKNIALIDNSKDVKGVNINAAEHKKDNVNSKSGVVSELWRIVGGKPVYRKKPKRIVLSPPRQPVDLPQVTVPVRIRQFDPNRRKV